MWTVSIIVPVYNGEVYLVRLIQSIMQQTWSDYELIVIDDGSTDNSLALLTKMKESFKEENKMIVIHQENGGISKARNRGLSEAQGEYIIFIDQDDLINNDYIEVLYNNIEKSRADIIISGFNKVSTNGKIIDKWILESEHGWSQYRITAPWGKIYRKTIIENNDLAFLDTKISEDMYFNLLFYSYSKKIVVISYIGYNWYYNKLSESHKNWSVMSDDRNPFIVLDQLNANMKSDNTLDREWLIYFFTKYLIWYLFFCCRGASRDLLFDSYEKAFLWLDNYYPEYNTLWKKELSYPLGERFSVKLSIKIVLFLKKIRLFKVLLLILSKI